MDMNGLFQTIGAMQTTLFKLSEEVEEVVVDLVIKKVLDAVEVAVDTPKQQTYH
jgi:hypothetical protein